MYRDKAKQREKTKERVRRYREQHRALPKDVTPNVTPSVIPVTPCNASVNNHTFVIPEELYSALGARAQAKSQSLSDYLISCLAYIISKGIPLYNPAIHKAGDRVLVRKGKKLVEAIVPEIDADGQVIPR